MFIRVLLNRLEKEVQPTLNVRGFVSWAETLEEAAQLRHSPASLP